MLRDQLHLRSSSRTSIIIATARGDEIDRLLRLAVVPGPDRMTP